MPIPLASFSGEGFYVGGQAGAVLGYKKLFFGVDLTMVELVSTGRLDAFGEEAGRNLTKAALAELLEQLAR